MTDKAELFAHAIRLGDDALILGQRLSEWCGHAPMLEIDLALSNISLDLFGQASQFLRVAGEAEGLGRDADDLAFRRDALDFRNCLLVEQPNGDFGQTIARQFLFSNWQLLLLREVGAAPSPELSQIARKAEKEVAYHCRFANEWIVRLGEGTAESRARTIAGLDWMWRFVDELFDPDVGAASLRPQWEAQISPVFSEAGLDRPKPRRGTKGGRVGHHSEHLGHLLAEMQFLPRAYPDATW
ncbi:MAG TPA: 1,2-phenylacetyl-CoA epoxidase subunit PaaC [Rhizomicrobium sp.]|jgi:ring-1,2-phenylacetyl-CoA epoxidase subunit PaaC|nr:1,2-phenylacetyl-CoA epoxidase subunit PaaC [Rhizomicrobium sp.]